MIEIKAVLILGRVSFQKYSKGIGMDLAFYGSFKKQQMWSLSLEYKATNTPLMRLRTYLAQIVKNFLNNEGIWMNVDNRGKHFLIIKDTKNTEWFYSTRER